MLCFVDVEGNFHIVQFFIQFAPYDVCPMEAIKYIKNEEHKKKVSAKEMNAWDDEDFRSAFVERCFQVVEEFCPGFAKSVIYKDVLSPVCIQ